MNQQICFNCFLFYGTDNEIDFVKWMVLWLNKVMILDLYLMGGSSLPFHLFSPFVISFLFSVSFHISKYTAN